MFNHAARYNVYIYTIVFTAKSTFAYIVNSLIDKSRLSSEHYGRAVAILEFLMIKRGVSDVSERHFSGHDIDVIVDFTCTA